MACSARRTRTLRALVQDEGWVLVTDNASDFRPMYAGDELHPGLIVMPAAVGRERQQQLVPALIDWIVDAAAKAGQPTIDFMLNRLVQVERAGQCSEQGLP